MKVFSFLFLSDFAPKITHLSFPNYCAKNPHLKYRYKLPQFAPQIIRREKQSGSKVRIAQKGRSPLYRLQTIKKRMFNQKSNRLNKINLNKSLLNIITAFNRFNNN